MRFVVGPGHHMPKHTVRESRPRTRNQRRNTRMTDQAEATRYAYEYRDGAGYPDENGTLSEDQIVLITK